DGHDDQDGTKDRIDPSNDLIDWQYCSDYEITEDDDERSREWNCTTSLKSDQFSRSGSECRSDQNHKYQRNSVDEDLVAFSKILYLPSGELCTFGAYEQHSQNIFMYRPDKDTAKNDPDECDRTIDCTRYRSKYRTDSCDVKQLDQPALY